MTATAAHVNGTPLHAPGEQLDQDTLRQRACTELLRQAAQRAGLLAASPRSKKCARPWPSPCVSRPG